MKTQFLLSGASGMIGSALRQELTAAGHSYKQLVRRRPRSESEIEWHPDRNQGPDPAALSGIEVAIHLSGKNLSEGRWTEQRKREIVESRVGPTQLLAASLCKAEPRPKAFVCASAVGIYGNRGEEVLDEQSAAGRGFLAETCLVWEAAAAKAAECQMRVVTTRFGIVLSQQGGALAKMLPLFRLGLGGSLGNGRQWMSWISLKDVARALVFVSEQALAESGRELARSQPAGAEPVGPQVEAINLVAPEPVTNAEFTKALGVALDRPTILPAPAFALRLAMGEMADEMLLASTRAVPHRLTQMGFAFHHPTLPDALKAEFPEKST